MSDTVGIDGNATVDLDVSGMTCAACALRIEKKLNRLEGVHASVNYATERASVAFDPTRIGPDELIEAVRAVGYDAAVPPPIDAGADEEVPDRSARRASALLRRLVVSTVLGVPVLLVSMIPPLQFRSWQWVALGLAAPVTTWGAWPFHRAALMNLRHRSTTMDTLISVGVTSAFLWSVWALVLGDAGHLGMRMGFSLRVDRSAGRAARQHADRPRRIVVRGTA